MEQLKKDFSKTMTKLEEENINKILKDISQKVENKQTQKKKPNLGRDIQKQKNRTETGKDKWILKSMNNGKLPSQQ